MYGFRCSVDVIGWSSGKGFGIKRLNVMADAGNCVRRFPEEEPGTADSKMAVDTRETKRKQAEIDKEGKAKTQEKQADRERGDNDGEDVCLACALESNNNAQPYLYAELPAIYPGTRSGDGNSCRRRSPQKKLLLMMKLRTLEEQEREQQGSSGTKAAEERQKMNKTDDEKRTTTGKEQKMSTGKSNSKA